MTDRLDKIKARLEAASPGPWRARRAPWEFLAGGKQNEWQHPEHWGIAAGSETWFDNAGFFHPDNARYVMDETNVVEIGYDRDYCYAVAGIKREPDADFIAHAPDDIAYLLSEIELLKKQNAALAAAVSAAWPLIRQQLDGSWSVIKPYLPKRAALKEDG